MLAFITLLTAVACRSQPTASPTPAPERASTETSPQVIVKRTLGESARVPEVAGKEFPGHKPIIWQVSVDTTPTASDVFVTLAEMSRLYSGMDRVIILMVEREENNWAVDIRWNLVTAREAAIQPPVAPGTMMLTVYRTSRKTINVPIKDNIVLGSSVTTDGVIAASNGRGPLFEAFRRETGLPE